MKLWITREKCYNLCLHKGKPTYTEDVDEWHYSDDPNEWEYLPNNMFPEITFENSPVLFADNVDDLLDDTSEVKSITLAKDLSKRRR